MGNITVTFKKTEPSEIIEKGELVELSFDNKVTRSSTELSNLIVGVAAKNFDKKPGDIPYYLYGLDINNNEVKQEEVEVIINGLATVKVSGHVNIGDLLVSSEEAGKAKAARYQEDKSNIGKIIGKAIQYTENEDEVIAIISFS